MDLNQAASRGIRNIALSTIVCLFGAPVLADTDADHDDRDGDPGSWRRGQPTVCEQTATTMRRACSADVEDDLLTTLASCANLLDASARSSCRRDARQTRREDLEFCDEVEEARRDACEVLGEDAYDPDPLLDASIAFIDPDDIFDGSTGAYAANPYVSLLAGHTQVIRAGDEGEETIVVTATEDTREILGVRCRVIVDIAVETSMEGGEIEYEAVEVTDDWMAQDVDGNVYYCGEVARNFEDGVLRDLDGSFEAGREHAKAGYLIRNFPAEGEAHRQEFALGEAEDIVQYAALGTMPTGEEGGDNPAFPCAPASCLKTFEFAPIDPGETEYKYYLPGTGFVLAVAMEDGELTGEREELVCSGDSIDILESPACAAAIPDPEALLDTLCEMAPQAYCAD